MNKKKKGYKTGGIGVFLGSLFLLLSINMWQTLSGQILILAGIFFGGLGVGSIWKPESIGQIAAEIFEFIDKNTREQVSNDSSQSQNQPRNSPQVQTDSGDIHIHQSINEEKKKKTNDNKITENLVNETKWLDEKDNAVYSYSLKKEDQLTGRISSDVPINVYITNSKNLQYYEDDEVFVYEKGSENVYKYSINFDVPKKGKWHIIIENKESNYADVNVKINLISQEID